MTIDSAEDAKISNRAFRIGPSIRIESRIGRTIRNRIESLSFAGPVIAAYLLRFLTTNFARIGNSYENVSFILPRRLLSKPQNGSVYE